MKVHVVCMIVACTGEADAQRKQTYTYTAVRFVA